MKIPWKIKFRTILTRQGLCTYIQYMRLTQQNTSQPVSPSVSTPSVSWSAGQLASWSVSSQSVSSACHYSLVVSTILCIIQVCYCSVGPAYSYVMPKFQLLMPALVLSYTQKAGSVELYGHQTESTRDIL